MDDEPMMAAVIQERFDGFLQEMKEATDAIIASTERRDRAMRDAADCVAAGRLFGLSLCVPKGAYSLVQFQSHGHKFVNGSLSHHLFLLAKERGDKAFGTNEIAERFTLHSAEFNINTPRALAEQFCTRKIIKRVGRGRWVLNEEPPQ